jgi:hypothetical protein
MRLWRKRSSLLDRLLYRLRKRLSESSLPLYNVGLGACLNLLVLLHQGKSLLQLWERKGKRVECCECHCRIIVYSFGVFTIKTVRVFQIFFHV